LRIHARSSRRESAQTSRFLSSAPLKRMTRCCPSNRAAKSNQLEPTHVGCYFSNTSEGLQSLKKMRIFEIYGSFQLRECV
jgi:hypothetical protein